MLAPGLGLAGAVLAIALGTGVGVLLLGAAGVIGSDTGLSAMGTLKLSLGSHGARLPAVFNLATLGVRNCVLKATLLGVFVYLGTTHIITTAHDVNGRLFAAHQLTQHVIDQAFFNQRPKPLRDFHYASGQSFYPVMYRFARTSA
jgi:cytosine/uracil/thiamine/allantoin permease